MITYRATAFALKAFSVNDFSKYLYRQIGNAIGGKRRASDVQAHYLARADGNLAFIEQHGKIADGMQVLELGTGWVHWEALFTRAFYDVKATVFDVWDNRQFDGFLTHVKALRAALPTLTPRGDERIAAAARLLDAVAQCSTFDEAYRVLGFSYLIDATGSLGAIADESIDLVFSSDVLEHVPHNALPTLAADLMRILKPGGFVAQQIVPSDHLCIYARGAHRKAYLQYSDREWRLAFENDVQYQNRWQQSDYVKLFREAGFEITADEIIASCDTTGLAIADRWRGYDKRDLDATVTRLLLRKPQRS